MAKKINGPRILIANRLSDGRAQFLTINGSWSKHAADAWLTDCEMEHEAALAIAEDHVARNLIIEPEFLEAELTPGGPVPRHPRYRIQDNGPTVGPVPAQHNRERAA